jgi:Na+/alanine symporter
MSDVCDFHSGVCAGIRNALSWKIFIWIFGVVLVITLAYVGFIQSQQNKILGKAEFAIEKTYENRMSLVVVEVTQSAILKNIEQLLRYYGMAPEVSSKDVEKEIKKNSVGE